MAEGRDDVSSGVSDECRKMKVFLTVIVAQLGGLAFNL